MRKRLILALFWYSLAAFGALTTISGTMYKADGGLFQGVILIKSQGFLTGGGVTVGPTNKRVTITAGTYSFQLESLTGATPSGVSYRAEYYLSGNAVPFRIEYWQTTDTTPVTIPAIVVAVQPTPVYEINLYDLKTTGASGVNVMDIRYSGSDWAAKTLFDSTVGVSHGTAAAGSAVEAARDDHVHPVTPTAAAGFDWGSATLPWKDFYLAGTSGTPATMNFKLTGASTSGTRVVTFPDANSNTVIPDTGAATNFLTGISSAGVITKAQPAFTDLSGAATDVQIPHLNTLSTNLTASRCVETDGSGLLTVAAAVCGTGSGYATIQDETAALTQRTTLDFQGAGVSCADSGGTKTVCTISGAAAGSSTWTKYTIGEAALTDADTSEDETLFSLPTGDILCGIKVKQSTAFTGGGLTAMTVQVLGGTSSATFTDAFDIFQAAGDTTAQYTDMAKAGTHATENVIARFTSTSANVADATAGSVDIWVCVADLP